METITTNVTEQESRLSRRESLLRDFVRFSWRATRGLTTAAESEGRELIHRMAEMGRITTEEEERLLKSLLGRMQASRRNFEERVDASVRKVVEQMHEISKRELVSLSEHVSRLERRIAELSKQNR
jgi:polyhydroxyalkanoate synthesis regulator phasin